MDTGTHVNQICMPLMTRDMQEMEVVPTQMEKQADHKYTPHWPVEGILDRICIGQSQLLAHVPDMHPASAALQAMG